MGFRHQDCAVTRHKHHQHAFSCQHLHSIGQARLHLISWHLPESEPVALKTLFVQSPNRLGEITEAGRVVQIQRSAVVISQYPREDWPL